MASNCTYIHGIGSSQNIDTAGEVVDIAGLDCSSLLGSVFNFEHKSDTPSQIVGKILDFKKIFSEEDCENEHHKYFWDKCKTPFLYVMGRLFDDKKDSSKELAALFLDDSQHPGEKPVIGFSVEGAKLDKKGQIITRSIARKITCTALPANKACVAEIVPMKNQPNDDIDSIFKTEATEIEFFKPTDAYIEFLNKKEAEMNKDVGSGNGAFMGSQLATSELKKAGGWTQGAVGEKGGAVNFQHPEHGMVSVHRHPEGHFEVKHNGAIAGLRGVKGTGFASARDAGKHAGSYMMSVSRGTTAGHKMQNRPSPQMLGKAIHTAPDPKNPGVSKVGSAVREANIYKDPKSHEKIKEALPHISKDPKDTAKWLQQEATQRAKNIIHSDKESQKPNTSNVHKIGGKQRSAATEETQKLAASENMNKALEAGSAMGAPSTLTQGAALGKEYLDKKIDRLGKGDTLPLLPAGPDEKCYACDKKIGKNPKVVSTRESGQPHVYVGSECHKLISQGGESGHQPSKGGPRLYDDYKHLNKPSHKKLNKNKWLARAEEAYKTWGKREQFEDFMKSRMPHLSKGEIKAIGQTIALTKSIKAENKMNKMFSSYFNKGTDIMMANEMEKALKFGTPADQAAVDAALERRKKNPPPKPEPTKKDPELKSRTESEVSHVEPYGDKHSTVHLKSGHILHGSQRGKFKVGDKVVATPHIMGTHILEHKK